MIISYEKKKKQTIRYGIIQCWFHPFLSLAYSEIKLLHFTPTRNVKLLVAKGNIGKNLKSSKDLRDIKWTFFSFLSGDCRLKKSSNESTEGNRRMSPSML